MDKKEKLNFFEKVFLAITDFRVYPFLLRNEKIGNAILYVITLVLVMSAILTVNLVSKINVVFEELIDNYDVTVPDFELKDSKLDVREVISKALNSKSYLLINTNYSYEQLKNTEDYENLFIYDSSIIITSDKIVMESDGEGVIELDFSDVAFNMNKSEMFNELLKYQSNQVSKIKTDLYIYLTVAITYLFVVIVRVIFIALIASIISLFFGIKASFSNYIKIAIYAYTLPFIIEIISVCVVGTIKDYAYYTSLALTYVYVLYALRAVKLDAFLTLLGGDKKENGIKNVIEKMMENEQKTVDDEEEKEDADDKEEKEEQKDLDDKQYKEK